MFKKLICSVSFVLLLSLSGHVSANVSWTDSTNDHLWGTEGNWNSGTVPTSADTVQINMLPGPTIANEGATTAKLMIATSSNGALTVDGGTLTTTGLIAVSHGEGREGTLNMISGTINTSGNTLLISYVGLGTINMNGGTIVAGSLRIGNSAKDTDKD